jgi:phosphatidylserine decarboxylase
MSLPVESDSFRFLIPLAIAIVVCFAIGWGVLGWICLGLFLFVAYFFRDPDRSAPEGDDLIIAPADGVINRIDTAYQSPQFPDGAVCVSIFLSIFNVHVQRTPVDGKVIGKRYNKGKFLAAWDHKASEDNEQSEIILSTKFGDIGVKQIAGLIARRIVCRAKVGADMAKGDRFGLIRFGSRVDLIVPPGFEVVCKLGDKVVAGESVMVKAGNPRED